MGSGGPAHDSLVAYAVEYCRRRGFEKVEVLDGHNRAHRKPVPDVVALDGTKKVAVECGRMAGGREVRLEELTKAGYDVVIEFPYLECFDWSMTTPPVGRAAWTKEEIAARIKSMGEASV